MRARLPWMRQAGGKQTPGAVHLLFLAVFALQMAETVVGAADWVSIVRVTGTKSKIFTLRLSCCWTAAARSGKERQEWRLPATKDPACVGRDEGSVALRTQHAPIRARQRGKLLNYQYCKGSVNGIFKIFIRPWLILFCNQSMLGKGRGSTHFILAQIKHFTVLTGSTE